MKKLTCILVITLVVLFVGAPSDSQANCTSPVMIGSGSTCGLSRNQLCDFGN